jgi:hypothetical protein
MGGLRRICKMYGGMKIDGVEWVWDYNKDEPRLKNQMTEEELRLSERAKWKPEQKGKP